MKKFTAIFALMTVLLCSTGCKFKIVPIDDNGQTSQGTVTGGANGSDVDKTPVDADTGTDNNGNGGNTGSQVAPEQGNVSETAVPGRPTRIWIEDKDTDVTFSDVLNGGAEVHGSEFTLKYAYPGTEISENCAFTDADGLAKVVTKIHMESGHDISEIDAITGGAIKAANCEDGIGEGNYVDYSNYNSRLYPDWMGKSFDYCCSQVDGNTPPSSDENTGTADNTAQTESTNSKADDTGAQTEPAVAPSGNMGTDTSARPNYTEGKTLKVDKSASYKDGDSGYVPVVEIPSGYSWSDLEFTIWDNDVLTVTDDGFFTIVTTDGKYHYATIYVSIEGTDYVDAYSVHVNE